MNIDELTVEVRDASFERVGQILPRDLVGFKAVLRFNNVGSWEITLPQGHEAGEILRLPGSGIIVTGNDEVILSGPTVSATNTKTSDNPAGEWLITGVDDSVVLGERLAYPSPDVLDVTQQTVAYDSRPGLASTAMYGYVEANIGSLAPTGRRIDNLALESDTGLGSFVYPAARFDVLGELLAGIASVDGLGFDIRQNDGTLVFRVFEPIDRSGEIRMDVANNTLSKTEYAYGSHSLSRAIVAGQGEGLNRQFLEITSTDSLAAESLWGRRIETFIDQRNTQDENELTQAGVEKLADGGATLTSVDVVPSNDLTMAYGRDWGLGDKVTVVVDGQEVSSTVTTVSMSIESDGVRVGATVGEPTGVDYESKMAKRTTSTAQRVNALERKESPALRWSAENETYEFNLDEAVVLQIGEDLVIRVKNASGSVAIPKFSVVMFAGSTGDTVTVSPAVSDGTISAQYLVGITAEEIPADGFGFVQWFGFIGKIDTSAWAVGTILYADPSVPGALTSTAPVAPAWTFPICAVTRSHAQTGRALVRAIPAGGGGGGTIITSDTAPTSPAPDTLWFDTSNGLLYVYFDDGDSSQWVEVKANSASDDLFDTRVTTVEGNINLVNQELVSLDSRLDSVETVQSSTLASSRMPEGSVIGFKHRNQTTNITYGLSNTPVNIAGVSINYTPKRANSLIVVQWMVNGESDNNVVMMPYRDASVITASGYESYNTTAGNVYYSGFVSASYDNDFNSTMSNYFIQYIGQANSTASTTFQLFAKTSSSGASNTFYLNRTLGSAGTSQYENTVSTVTIWEIAQ